MRFRVIHKTAYRYRQPASESYAELRVWPQDSERQHVIKRELKTDPVVPVETYTDYFGNRVEYFSVPFRHNHLTVNAVAEVETKPPVEINHLTGITLAEARQIYNSQAYRLFDYMRPTEAVSQGPEVIALANSLSFFSPGCTLHGCLTSLNAWIFKTFRYAPGTTDVSTPLADVISQRSGVCQDFAHLMLALLRARGLPCRYVSGYIEAYDPEITDEKLIGAAASHAWLEVLLPGDIWWGLDPTNNQTAGERHVEVAFGRDYHDVAPMRGTFKGARDQRLQVMVSLKRK